MSGYFPLGPRGSTVSGRHLNSIESPRRNPGPAFFPSLVGIIVEAAA
jgi:hypothetical protein